MATAVLLLCDARFDRSKVRTRGWIRSVTLPLSIESVMVNVARHGRRNQRIDRLAGLHPPPYFRRRNRNGGILDERNRAAGRAFARRANDSSKPLGNLSSAPCEDGEIRELEDAIDRSPLT